MAYRALLQATDETVQDVTLSATRRLDEAEQLLYGGRHHSAIYLAGLSAEMYLKSAFAYLIGARPADPIDAYLGPVRRTRGQRGPLRGDYESGHGLWFWSQVLLEERRARRRVMSRQFQRAVLGTCASLYSEWFVGMRYRPGSAGPNDALTFLATAEWLKANHAALIT
jgi:hypothetical protein